MKLLRQSTAAVLSFGPFLLPADGVTPVTSLVSALDHASTGIFLSKAGGAFAIRNAAVTASTYDAYGNYRVTLDTTDTGTLGRLRVQFAAAASCLPVWDDWMVVPAMIYDSLVAGTDALDVSITAASLAADMDTYQAKVSIVDDDTGTADRYVVAWFKNGQPVTAGITTPLIQVYKIADGADLVASTAMTEIASTQTFRYVEATNRVVSGVGYIAKATATIGGSARTWLQPVGRDS